jgi:hypothetical protein
VPPAPLHAQQSRPTGTQPTCHLALPSPFARPTVSSNWHPTDMSFDLSQRYPKFRPRVRVSCIPKAEYDFRRPGDQSRIPPTVHETLLMKLCPPIYPCIPQGEYDFRRPGDQSRIPPRVYLARKGSIQFNHQYPRRNTTFVDRLTKVVFRLGYTWYISSISRNLIPL